MFVSERFKEHESINETESRIERLRRGLSNSLHAQTAQTKVTIFPYLEYKSSFDFDERTRARGYDLFISLVSRLSARAMKI